MAKLLYYYGQRLQKVGHAGSVSRSGKWQMLSADALDRADIVAWEERSCHTGDIGIVEGHELIFTIAACLYREGCSVGRWRRCMVTCCATLDVLQRAKLAETLWYPSCSTMTPRLCRRRSTFDMQINMAGDGAYLH